jgi:thymidylate synthase (FAD)
MKVEVLDHGYVELVEAWGQGRIELEKGGRDFIDGQQFGNEVIDHEVGIIEAARQSTQGSFRGWDQDAKLLKYLYEHKHLTPFEFSGMVLEVQAPIFVFREWHRHRTQSYNEMSARYAALPDLYYMPELPNLMERGNVDTRNKQARADHRHPAELVDSRAKTWLAAVREAYDHLERLYKDALADGVPKELARITMPVGHYSRMRTSTSLRNWLQFLTLRMDPAAQWEIRMFANAVAQVVRTTFPRTWQLFCGDEHE